MKAPPASTEGPAATLALRFELLDQEDIERLSPTDKILYDLYWVIKCQSSPTWHHQRNENGCLGCINTVNGVVEEVAALSANQGDAKRIEEAVKVALNEYIKTCQDLIKWHGERMGREYVATHDGMIRGAQEALSIIAEIDAASEDDKK